MIPPHGCWQCKLEYDDLPHEERVGLFKAMADVEHWDVLEVLRGVNFDHDEAVRRGEAWVDERFVVDHEAHKPESWIG